MIELGGYSGISLEAIAEDFGEPQYRSRNRGDRDQDRDRANSDPIDGPTTGIGKLKVWSRALHLSPRVQPPPPPPPVMHGVFIRH